MKKNQILNIIAENVKKAIVGNWDKAELEIEVADKFSSYNGFFYKNDEKFPLKVSKMDFNIGDYLIELYHETVEVEKVTDNWNTAKFLLYTEGNFEINYWWNQERHDLVYGK